MPTATLLCGQVSTVAEVLPEDNVLVEFTDDSGHAQAITPIKIAKLLVLQYEQEEALGEWIANCSQKGREKGCVPFSSVS